MSTKEDAAAATIAAYGDLIDRALSIVDKAPHWQFVYEPSWARISIEGNKATLMWPHASGGGFDESCEVEREEVTFPAALLFTTEEELAAWKAEQTRLYEEKERQREAARMAAIEADERRALAALKARYER